MSPEFDPYHKWLSIPPKDQPPHHYRLLGVELFEGDQDVIDSAANRVMSYLKELAAGDESGCSQQLLNEVSQARLCLLNPEKKAAYDHVLRGRLADTQPPAAMPSPPPPRAVAHTVAPPVPAPPAQHAASPPAPVQQPPAKVPQASSPVAIVGPSRIAARRRRRSWSASRSGCWPPPRCLRSFSVF